jgi:molybdopterin converting factor subunit 1
MTAGTARDGLRISIRLFAHYAESVGRARLEVALPAGATVGDLLAEFRRQIPAAAALPERLLCAVNLMHVLPAHPLRDGDEVAILPPLAGG